MSEKLKSFQIRSAIAEDITSMRSLYEAAFPKEESGLVSKLACNLLEDSLDERIFSLVAESEDLLLGHVAFSPIYLNGDAEPSGSILAPLAVNPTHQKRGVGSQLVKKGIRKLITQNTKVLFVYGDPAYYERFGFRKETADGFVPPFELQYGFGWQAIVLEESGEALSLGRIACVAALNDSKLW